MRLVALLQIAGVLHLGLLAAGATMSKVVDLNPHLSLLPQFIRRLFWVYYGFIGFVLLSFGALTLIHARAMAAGEGVAGSLSIMMTVFWAARLSVAAFVLDVRPYLNCWQARLGYQLTNIVFAYLLVVYGWASLAWLGLGHE